MKYPPQISTSFQASSRAWNKTWTSRNNWKFRSCQANLLIHFQVCVQTSSPEAVKKAQRISELHQLSILVLMQFLFFPDQFAIPFSIFPIFLSAVIAKPPTWCLFYGELDFLSWPHSFPKQEQPSSKCAPELRSVESQNGLDWNGSKISFHPPAMARDSFSG